jgi:PKD repeat protein
MQTEFQSQSQTFVTIEIDSSITPSTTTWDFFDWPKGYAKTPNHKIYVESGRTSPAQKVLQADLAKDGSPNRLVRLFYGEMESKFPRVESNN